MAKKAGTASRGNEFEALVPALFSLRLLQDPEVADFSFKSNIKGFGAMDDLIIWVKLNDGNENNFAMQLKHKENNNKKLQPSSLTAKTGDFSLLKYSQDWQEEFSEQHKKNFNLILYTNMPFDEKNKEKVTIFEMKINETCPGRKWFDTRGIYENIYLFQTKNSLNNYDEFFEKFSFYTYQKGIDEFVNEIKELLWSKFRANEDIAKLYNDFFRDWYYDKYGKKELKAQVITYELLYLVLKGFLVKPLPGPQVKNEKFRLILEAIKQFNITLCNDLEEEPLNNYLQQQFSGVMQDIEILEMGKKKNLILNSVQCLTDDLKQKVFGFYEHPLLVKIASNVTICTGIELLLKKCSTVKLVLLGKKMKVADFGNYLKIFQTLQDLYFANPNLYNEIIRKFEVSIQGREKCSIETLIEVDEEIANVITLKALVQMLDDDFVIGEGKEILPDYYLGRTLCRKIKEKGNEIEEIEESKISSKLKDTINVLCAKPGMGKSTMMKYFKNNCPTSHWTIKIDFNHHETFFAKKAKFRESIEYFLDFISENLKYNEISRATMTIFVRNKNCFFYWDSMDELNSKYVDCAIEIISKFHINGYYQWVCSRPNLQRILEEKLNVSCYDILEIDVSKQKNYITNRLQVKMDLGQIQEIIEKIYRKNLVKTNNEVLGPPLQLHILTEVLLLNIENWSEIVQRISVLSFMYRQFIEGKIFHYLDKNKIGRNAIPELVMSAQKHQINVLQALALKSCFKSTDLSNYLDAITIRNLNKNANFIKTICDSRDYLGIIVNILDDDSVIFEHNSYKEFFSAWWMTENLQEISKLKNIIFDEEFSNVRYFFDMILAEKSPNHLAVLYKNVEELQEIEEIEDDAGRTPLHLACSWGVRHPLLQMKIERSPRLPLKKSFKIKNCLWRKNRKKQENSTILVHFSIRSLPSRDKVHEHVTYVTKLASRCDPEKIDRVFGLNAAQYADRACALSGLEGISGRESFKVNLEELKNFDNLLLLSYYCVEYDYRNLFKQIVEVLPFFYVDRPYRSLYDHACEFLRKDIANYFKLNQIYFDAIKQVSELHKNMPTIDSSEIVANSYDLRGRLTLLRAIENRRIDIVKKLIENDFRNIDQTDIDGYTARSVTGYRYCAYVLNVIQKNCNDNESGVDSNKNEIDKIQKVLDSPLGEKQKILTNLHFEGVVNNNVEVVKFLLDKGRDVNQCNSVRETLLMVAAERGNFAMVKMLVEEYNADIHLTDKCDECAGFKAAINNEISIVEYLIKKNIKIKQKSKLIDNILTYCARMDYWNLGKLLIEKCEMDINKCDKDENTVIFFAAKKGDLQLINYLIGKNANLFHSNKTGDTLITVAARYGNLPVLELLLGARKKISTKEANQPQLFLPHAANNGNLQQLIDINKITKDGNSALLLAADNNHFHVVDFLISKGANKNQISKYDNMNLLLYAAAKGNLTLVQQLIEDNFDVNVVDFRDNSPLLLAASNYHFDVVEFLISKGANKKQIGRHNKTLLSYAAEKGNLPLVKKLINEDDFPINAVNFWGNSALLLAASNNHFEIVEFLISMGANKQQIGGFNKTLLSYAAEKGNLPLVQQLIDEDIFDINAVDIGGNSALLLAASNNQFDVVKFLILRGANKLLVNSYKHSLLLYAAECGNLVVVKQLVDEGCFDINAIDFRGNSALLLAANNNHFDVVEFLISKGANRLQVNHFGNNLLMYAAKGGNLLFVQKLVEEDLFDFKAKNRDSNSALLLAEQNQHTEVVEYLRSKGGNPTTRN